MMYLDQIILQRIEKEDFELEGTIPWGNNMIYLKSFIKKGTKMYKLQLIEENQNLG
jgi:hypothetical protein